MATTVPGSNDRWQALRSAWVELQDPRLQSYDETDFSQDLRRRHTDTLQALVADQELQAEVAEAIGIAFAQAIDHIRRNMATCYIAVPFVFFPREDLTSQAAALNEMSQRSDIDPNTVARARVALGRDIAWLAQFEAGIQPGELDSIPVSAAAAEAARLLAEVLSRKTR